MAAGLVLAQALAVVVAFRLLVRVLVLVPALAMALALARVVAFQLLVLVLVLVPALALAVVLAFQLLVLVLVLLLALALALALGDPRTFRPCQRHQGHEGSPGVGLVGHAAPTCGAGAAGRHEEGVGNY